MWPYLSYWFFFLCSPFPFLFILLTPTTIPPTPFQIIHLNNLVGIDLNLFPSSYDLIQIRVYTNYREINICIRFWSVIHKMGSYNYSSIHLAFLPPTLSLWANGTAPVYFSKRLRNIPWYVHTLISLTAVPY